MAKQADAGGNKATGNENVAADRPGKGIAGESSGSLIGFVAVAAVVTVARLVAKLWGALTRDGVLAAAARQGADELGQALRAFPR